MKLTSYMLPHMPFDNRDFSARAKANSGAKNKRKEDTSAITPLLPELRAVGHLRWNQIHRLREAFKRIVTAAKKENRSLPLDFYYDESEYANERWYFVLWNVPSFEREYEGKNGYLEQRKDEFFLEFIRVERLHWFVTSMLRGIYETSGTTGDIEDKKKQLIEYMKWRDPETLQVYEHYYDESKFRDLHEKLQISYMEREKEFLNSLKSRKKQATTVSVLNLPESSSDWLDEFYEGMND
ncbi:hypothetical protein [Paenibacillus cremeus]|uniref:hypothetical protein n=1 Tax=Paenibacillus cremeus TaxID=2163881 RepID=UPI001C953564|nr:hypothetical protein [Paenibacillus cremeus]